MTWQLPDLTAVAGALERHRGRVALDCETRDEELKKHGPGVRRPDCYVVGVALALERGPSWYLPIAHTEGPNLPRAKTLALLKRWARGFDGELVGANLAGYDLDFLAEAGVEFPRAKLRDVLLAEPLLDENLFDYSLDAALRRRLGLAKQLGELPELAARFGKTKAEQAKLRKSPQNVLWRLPAKQVAAYALGDVEPLFDLLAAQERLLEAEDLGQVWDLECRLAPLTLAMTRRGVPVNVRRVRQLKKQFDSERDQLIAELSRRGKREVKLWVPETLAPALEAEGHRLPLTPKTRKPSVTSAWLEAAEDEVPGLIRRARQLDKLSGTFFESQILGKLINGRVHPRWHQLRSDEGGTISGRFSCSDPNMQFIPARTAEGKLIRTCFVPETGEDWVRDDLEQIEFKLLVHYARGRGAEEARQLYNEKPDTSFHKMVGDLAKLDWRDEYIYKQVKCTNFAKVYGGGAAKIALTAGIPLGEAEEFVDEYDQRLPFVKKTNQAAAQTALNRGWVRSLSGRRHRFTLWEPAGFDLSHLAREEGWAPRQSAEAMRYELKRRGERSAVKRYRAYKALNSVLQGGAADLIKEVMARQAEAGLWEVLGPLLAMVHDEEGWSRPRTPAGREACDEARDVFRQVGADWGLRVPITTSREVGRSWGAVKAKK